MYLLKVMGQKWRPLGQYCYQFNRVFPDAEEVVYPQFNSEISTVVSRIYSLRTFERFAIYLGLAEYKIPPEEINTLTYETILVRKTPFLDDFIYFPSSESVTDSRSKVH